MVRERGGAAQFGHEARAAGASSTRIWEAGPPREYARRQAPIREPLGLKGVVRPSLSLPVLQSSRSDGA